MGPALGLIEPEDGGPKFADGSLDVGCEVNLGDAIEATVGSPGGVDGGGVGGLWVGADATDRPAPGFEL